MSKRILIAAGVLSLVGLGGASAPRRAQGAQAGPRVPPQPQTSVRRREQRLVPYGVQLTPPALFALPTFVAIR